MVSCRLTTDAIPAIILNERDCDDVSGPPSLKIQRRCEKNEATPPAVGLSSPHPPPSKTYAAKPAIGTSTRRYNFIRYFTKFTAITIAAAYVVSLASAFTQPQNRKGATGSSCTSSEWQHLSLLGNKLSSVTIIYNRDTLRKSSSSPSSSGLFLSTDNKSSAAVGSTKSDQQEWRAVFLALQLYKAAFGDLNVPARFVVPAAAPWPGMYSKQYSANS